MSFEIRNHPHTFSGKSLVRFYLVSHCRCSKVTALVFQYSAIYSNLFGIVACDSGAVSKVLGCNRWVFSDGKYCSFCRWVYYFIRVGASGSSMGVDDEHIRPLLCSDGSHGQRWISFTWICFKYEMPVCLNWFISYVRSWKWMAYAHWKQLANRCEKKTCVDSWLWWC